ncbi:MAG: Hsp20/alpha crystallin family protein [Planctomycetota bacterium]
MFGSRFFPTLDLGVDELHRELDRMFERALGPGSYFTGPAFPAVNVYEDEERIVVCAELPGVDPAQVNVTVTGDVLALRGARETLTADEQRNAHRRERPHGKFAREVLLPVQVDSERVEATFENGILAVVMPKAPQSRPKQIAVQVK